jgi:hypothetical protein
MTVGHRQGFNGVERPAEKDDRSNPGRHANVIIAYVAPLPAIGMCCLTRLQSSGVDYTAWKPAITPLAKNARVAPLVGQRQVGRSCVVSLRSIKLIMGAGAFWPGSSLFLGAHGCCGDCVIGRCYTTAVGGIGRCSRTAQAVVSNVPHLPLAPVRDNGAWVCGCGYGCSYGWYGYMFHTIRFGQFGRFGRAKSRWDFRCPDHGK